MRGFANLLVLALSSVSFATALSEYDAVVLVKNFADSLMAPHNVDIANTGNNSLFAADVQGRIDIIGDIQGRQLATEYMYGLFAGAAIHPDVPTIVGTPIAYNVTNLAVQRNIVSASILIDLNYTHVSRQLPLELGAWFAIDHSAQISAYDITFRRWTSAVDDLLPTLLPAMAKWSGAASNTTDPSLILRQYLGRTICGTSLLTCANHNAPWSSVAACTEYVTNATLGSFDQLGDDSLACRAIHASLASLRPDYHCAAMGPSSTTCSKKDYAASVKNNYFSEGFVAPKVVTPENEDQIGDYQVVNGVPITPLLKISLFQDGMKSWEPTLFATATFVFMLSLWVVAKLTYLAYNQFSKTFRALPNETLKTNVVMYVMNIFYTTVAVALQAVAIPAFWGAYNLNQVLCMRSAAIIISGLYCFELIFRFDMRLPLVAHHFFTVFAICFAVTLLEVTSDMTFMLSGVIWLCQATTEQPTFLGLYMYRMARPSPFVANLLRVAAVQTLIFKVASAVGVIVVWTIHQKTVFQSIDAAWSAMVFTISVGLMTTQVWGSWVTWKLGDRVMSKYRKNLVRRSSINDRDNKPAVPVRRSSHTAATPTQGYVHEFKDLYNTQYQSSDSYAPQPIIVTPHSEFSEQSVPVSPTGSQSSKKPILGKRDTSSTLHVRHADSARNLRPEDYFSRPYSTMSTANSTSSFVDPYGRAQVFGDRDSVWSGHAETPELSRAGSPYGSTHSLPRGATPAAHGREGPYRHRTGTNSMAASQLAVCIEGEGAEQGAIGDAGIAGLESDGSDAIGAYQRPPTNRFASA